MMINASMQVASPDKNIQVKVKYAVRFHQDRLLRINTCGITPEYHGPDPTIKVSIKRWSNKTEGPENNHCNTSFFHLSVDFQLGFLLCRVADKRVEEAVCIGVRRIQMTG